MYAWIMFWFRTRVDPRRYSLFFQAWALDSLSDLLVSPAPRPESNGHVVFAHNVRCLQLFVDIISLNFYKGGKILPKLVTLEAGRKTFERGTSHKYS